MDGINNKKKIEDAHQSLAVIYSITVSDFKIISWV